MTTTSTMVLDLTTIGHALSVMLRTLGTDGVRPVSDEQHRFVNWFLPNREELETLIGLEALASDSHEVLNQFLTECRFDPMFRPFRGIGVVSVLDMLVEWSARASCAELNAHTDDGWQTFSAFEIPQGGVEFFVVPGSHEPLIRIDTRSGHRLWLIETNAPTTAFDLPFLAQDLLDGPYERDNSERFSGVRIPTLEIDTKPDIDWLKNMGVGGTRGITDAFQQFKLRMNETGAHVKVASGISARSVSYQFNQPFLGFFTQPGHDRLPLACFYAGFDAWRTPKGTLNEL